MALQVENPYNLSCNRWNAMNKAIVFFAVLPFMVLAQGGLDATVRDLFANKCAFAGCHAGNMPAANLDLTPENYAANLIKTKSKQAPEFFRVKPGDASNSYLVRKIAGKGIRGERMPLNNPPLSQGELDAITQWIRLLPANFTPTAPRRLYARAFPGWSVGDLPTAETLESGAFMYRITHRFRSTIDTGFENFFGLDGGTFAYTQVAFPVSTNLDLGIARQGLNATFEIGAKLRLLRERADGRLPISLAFYVGTDWATRTGLPDPNNQNAGLKTFAGERFAYFAQMPISKKLSEHFALVLVPSMLLNSNVMLPNEAHLFAFGFGAKYAFNQKYAIFANLIPILSGDATAATVNGPRVNGNNTTFNDTFMTGFEIKSGGHVFHIFVTNSAGNSTNQYLSGGDLDLSRSKMRLGFNIYRTLNYPSF